MNCPRCNGTLSPAQYEGIEIDCCGKCGGAWLDAGELKPILDTPEEKFTDREIQDALQSAKSGISETEQESVEKCPVCQDQMAPQNFNFSSGIIIDVCLSGHGLWFDRDELAKSQINIEHWNERKNSEGHMWAQKAQDEAARTKAELDFNQLQANLKTGGPVKRLLARTLYRLEQVSRHKPK